jgi:cell division septation protein DedD
MQMENRLKERLTGAAILVALIVLLVPEMFHGQRRDVAASAGSGEGAPVRSYTIDLSNGPARTAPLQSTPGTSGANAGGETAAEAVPAHPTPHAQAPAPPPVSPPSTASAAATPPAAAPAAADSPAAHSASTVSAASANAPRNAPPPAQRASASAGPWSVQLGLFAQRENAERLAHSAQSKGFAVNVSAADAKGHFRVRVAGLADRASAQALQQRLRGQGFTAAIVAP